MLTDGAGSEQAESQDWKKLWTLLKTGGDGGELHVSVQSGVLGHPCRSNSHFGFKVTRASLIFLAQRHTLKK